VHRPVWWKNKKTQMHLYTSIVIPSAIYESETWKTTDKTNKMLSVFNRRCLHDITVVSWKDRITNEKLLSAGVGDLQDTVAAKWRRFIGPVLRLPTSRPASLVIDWTPEGGSRRRMWQNTFREDMQEWVSVAVALMACCQWPCSMETTRHPLSKPGQEDLSLSKSASTW